MYSFAIACYAFIVRLVSPFNKKAQRMIRGQKNTWNILEKQIDKEAKYIWVHAASLGEFEQGRPLIEKIRKENPEYKILLSFFSPSGYEVRKDYPGADIVCYLPFDFKSNVKRFLELTNPKMAIFIKYEFWMNYLNALKKRAIPTYIISAIFRPNQIFFRWYGKPYFQILRNYKWLFVQDQDSQQLLNSYGIENISVSGDTRFDRVLEIHQQRKELPLVEKFLQTADNSSGTALIVGSSWAQDEEIILPYFNQHPEIKLVIAPHEVNDSRIKEITSKLTRPYVRYSQASETEVAQSDCLIIDCFGILSSIYRYSDIAYIGGGFGKGIHNSLEAAVYGVPVIFGPNFQKFKEARDLVQLGGAFSVANSASFNSKINAFLADTNSMKVAGQKAGQYVQGNSGATEMIYQTIFE